ncbi:Crp/Fnr family transcriptional regulator [Butyricicoccus faecihominis]|uniref:Crp/Fnr family transcriptional regulator n=1 Tax=Butyricicoccus faecihominis TaxID=1712515 RepID=UPI00247AA417|nr:Crp/Fnr family transcriptional regulator [Butyricicoccus faecihominis]MCQ5129768.1 Crp/Fnr family transcriptional regulator [Butyricicoccus faecihominis]
MALDTYLPFWNRLTEAQQRLLQNAAREERYPARAVLHNGSADCIGFLLVTSGQLRAYLLSEDGKELTLYRLFERDICLLSASCMLRGIDFDITVEAERDTVVWHIPPETYKRLMDQSLAVAAYTNELMASRFSDVMWLMDQVMNKKLDSRLSALLIEEQALAGSDALHITHEQLAHHLGSAREVVTRVLKYLQGEGLVRLTRGTIEILDRARLAALAADSLR